MSNIDLEILSSLTKKALGIPYILETIKLLKKEILRSDESFIWKALSEQLLEETFPNEIQSGWIFVLKPDTTTPSHYHPNSVQYTTVIEGQGRIKIGEKEEEVRIFDSRRTSPIWYIIPENVSHSVTITNRAMVIFSFHTCPTKELVEVETSSGRSRVYER